MSNTFGQSDSWNQKPQQHEPPYGSAYDNTSNTTAYNNNAWAGESNKTEYNNNNVVNAWDSTPQQPTTSQSAYGNQQQSTMPTPQSAYQYSGTPHGNQSLQQGNAYSAATPANQTQPMKESVGPDPWKGEVYHRPNKWRLLFRFILLLASIGHLGFAAGARPVSK